jgi:hypothetical protein
MINNDSDFVDCRSRRSSFDGQTRQEAVRLTRMTFDRTEATTGELRCGLKVNSMSFSYPTRVYYDK